MDITAGTAARVREAIEAGGESINSVSEKSGIPYATLWRKVNARGPFTVTELGHVSEALKVRVVDLLPVEPVDKASA
ncbi:MAG: hypothetical protein QJR09_12065 [Micrococcus sp.]|nr:hypothetical protein [Micrococcus sp.]